MRRRAQVLHAGAPLVLVVLVCAADLLSGEQIVFDLLCAVPLLVAQLDGPRHVLAWGAVCVALQLALGVVDDAYGDPDALQAQVVRVAFTVLTTAVGAALSARRLRLEGRLRRLTDVALTAQRTILRDLPPQVGGWRLAVDYSAAEREARIGGDLYDVLDTERGLLLLIGDVRGKGLPAVRLASLVLGTFRHPTSRSADPAAVFDALHQTVEQHGGDEDFVTALLVELQRDGRCRSWSAGHPSPLLLRQDGSAVPVPVPPTPPLGLGQVQRPGEVVVGPGERLLLHTDGLVEARRPQDGAMFPLDAVAAGLLGSGSVDDAVRALRDALRAWTGGALADDVALLVVEQPAGPAPPAGDRVARPAGRPTSP